MVIEIQLLDWILNDNRGGTTLKFNPVVYITMKRLFLIKIFAFLILHQLRGQVTSAKHFNSVDEFYKYLGTLVKEYPDEALKNQIEGKVFIQFIHTSEGKIIEPKVIKGIGYGCDELALSLLTGFQGTVGHQLARGKPVNQKLVVPITFNLPKYSFPPKLDDDSILSFVNCKRALESTDVEFIGYHLAALKYFDHQMHFGSSMQSFQSLLNKALVRKEYNDTLMLYKFPLYQANSDFTLIDEPRSNYDFYAIIADEDKQVIVSHYFLYYNKVKYRPKYDAFVFDDVKDANLLIEQIKNDGSKGQITRNAIRQLSYDRSDARSVDFLHDLLQSNIKNGTGDERETRTTSFDGIIEKAIHESINEELIAALSRLDAHDALPTLYSLLDAPAEKTGIEKQNLLHYLYNLAEEPIEYVENGLTLIYPESHVSFVQEWVARRK